MSELLLQPPKHLELSHSRKLKCFFPRHDRLGPPQAVGPACLPLASFIFVYSPSFGASSIIDGVLSGTSVASARLNRGVKDGEEEGNTEPHISLAIIYLTQDFRHGLPRNGVLYQD